MRAKYFITEYNRNITAKNLERDLLRAVTNDNSNEVEGIHQFTRDNWPMTDHPRRWHLLDDLLKTIE